MEQISELRDSLNGCFQWNKARMTLFAKMLVALIVTRTVNLNKIACAISSDAEQASRYRRLQRFFAKFTIDFDMIAGFIFQLFFISTDTLRQTQWYLTIDRTNWRWGKSDINILTLAIAFKGIAIPIYWELEDTHITNHERIKKLFVLLAIAFCWSHKTGEWQHEIKPIPIKKHGRPAVSLFRCGLDYIINAVMKIFHQPDLFKKCLDKISRYGGKNVLGIPIKMCG
jgi:hypothetical protein